MRIPPSVVVMSLVTAVPFGLAIRDTTKHHDDEAEWDPDGSKAAMRLEQEQEARYAEEARQAELAAGKVKDVRKALLGSTPGTMGKALASFELGVTSADFDYSTFDQSKLRTDAHVAVGFNAGAKTLQSVVLSVDDDCYDFESSVIAPVWGEGMDHVWMNPATQQRATWDAETCSLTFERYTSVDQWIDNSLTAAVPVGAIGQPFAKIPELAGVQDVSDTVTWTAPGLVGGQGPTQLEGYLKNGKIAAIRVQQKLGSAGADGVRDRLTGLFGQPKVDETYGYYDWKRPKIHFETTSTHLILEIGTIPE